ncbi:maintenance of ploidy protein MOB1 [Vigna unguiculata]|uniref:Maintenance of ploidy protein MOB1 n=1 Tax=Vigna unguiculata TaxID=3917 RepID=A0A4D6LQA5_VIGUN|nr:maintenance of ploidy protein MOB1 [Vigna unguiculata]
MAEAILGVVLEKLTSLAVEELRSFMGFNTDLEKLRVMLTSIEAILDDAAEKQFSSQSVKYWLEMLKDASYELNDILDECAELTLEYQGIKCGSYHEVCSCLSYFRPKHAAFHYTIAKRMKSICERLDTIAEERYMFQLTAKPPRSGGVYERLQTTSVIVESRVYGREEDEQNIVDFLMANADDIETDEFSHVTSFKIHNIVHDLLKFAAEEVCCITNDNDVTVPERIRHISEHSWRSTLDSAQFRFESLRTYLLPPQRYKTGQLSPQVLKCYNLRVLQYEPTETLSSSISRLKHLRYLNVSGGDFVTIPKSLCRLWNLQILKLDHCHRLQKLPKNLIGLKALQKLSLNGCSSLSSLPRQMGKLTSLRNLSMYIVCEKKGFLLAELGPLKLKGDLDIKHLEKVRSVEDAKEAKMSEKQLNRLSLSWDNNEATELQENVEEILQVLEPSTNQLASLSVVGYKGACFPQWMSSSFLKYLELEDCKMCSKLPQLGKLRFLKSLSISKMTPVEYLYEEDSYDGEAVFIALEFLFLKELSNLKRLLKREDGENMFPLLNKLEIAECPNLLGLPSLPSIRNLHIQGKCNQHLLTSVKKLSSLQDLWLEDNEELRFFPDGMFQGLTSLKELYFHRLFKLEIFPTKLPDSLEKLEFVGCHKFVSAGLHEALQNVTALHSLKFEHLPNLASLPDCFQKLALLRELALYNCSKLKCLPASLKFCALKRLDIQGCPELEKRCQEYTGEDWPIISTIPNIRVIPMRR